MPAFFLTLSSNDKYWHELQSIYGLSDPLELSNAVKNDPFTAVSYFRSKLLAFFNLVLIDKIGIDDFFIKFEFHGHALSMPIVFCGTAVHPSYFLATNSMLKQ